MLVVLLLSCVTKATHELVEVQLDATRTALSAKNASCYEEVRDRDNRLLVRDEALSTLQARHDQLQSLHDQQQEELTSLRAQLAGELAEQIAPATTERVQAALTALAQQELASQQRDDHLAMWQARLSALTEQGRLTVHAEGDAVLVRIPTVQIFNEGRVSVSPRGEVLLVALSEALEGVRRDRVQVIAHTDSAPYHSAQHASNWELGFAQAMTLVRTLQTDQGTGRMLASSAAGSMPLVQGDDEKARKQNRRIEILIQR